MNCLFRFFLRYFTSAEDFWFVGFLLGAMFCVGCPNGNASSLPDMIQQAGDANPESAPDSVKDLGLSDKQLVTDAASMHDMGNGTNGHSLLFDGKDDLVALKTILGSSDPLLLSFTIPVTIEFWIRIPQGAQNDQVVVEQSYQGSTSSRVNFRIRINPIFGSTVKQAVECRSEANATSVVALGASNVIDGNWHHVACSSDGTRLTVFVDGTERGYVDKLDEYPIAPKGPAISWVGRAVSNKNLQGLQGWLDELRIWNKYRGSNEIQSDMKRSLVGAHAGLVGCWNMEEGSGQQVEDACGSNGVAPLGSSKQPESQDPAWSTEVPFSP